MTPDPMAAALDQLAAHHDKITELDYREARHHTAITARLAELTDLTAGIGRTLHDYQATPTRLQDPGHHATGRAAADQDPGRYRPGPAPAWWNLAAADRQQPVAQLGAWVEQVYRPGYGHLAAALAPCWASHDLCLYGLDIAASLWSTLYLQQRRSPGILSAQAEYQARILPALAAQLMTETTGCGHTRHPLPAPGPVRSAR